jgi:PAS domain S-box-containing protein
VGRTLGYLDPEYVGSEVFAWHRRALESGGPSSLDQLSYERSTGGRRLRKAYELRAVPLGGGRLAVTWREITERKRKEDELLLRSAVLNRVAEGVCLIRPSDGVIVYANPKFDRMFGYEPGELLGRRVSELNWEDESSNKRRPRDILSELDERGEVSYKQLNRRKDGTPVWVEAHIAAFLHPDHGKVLVAVQQDVTAREEAWETVRLSEERVRLALRGAPFTLYTMDRALRYTWVFNNQVGLEGDESAVGRTDEEIFGRELAGQLTKINRRALAGAAVRAKVEFEVAGGRSTFELAVGPLRSEDGHVIGVAGAAYDLTPRGRFDRVAST